MSWNILRVDPTSTHSSLLSLAHLAAQTLRSLGP